MRKEHSTRAVLKAADYRSRFPPTPPQSEVTNNLTETLHCQAKWCGTIVNSVRPGRPLHVSPQGGEKVTLCLLSGNKAFEGLLCSAVSTRLNLSS